MSVELNWHEGEDQDGVTWDRAAEPLPLPPPPTAIIAHGAAARTGPSRLTLLLIGVAIGIALGLAGLAALLLARANQGGQWAQRDVTAAAAQLLEAQTAGDVQRYAELLDSSDQVWKARLVAGLSAASQRQPDAWVVERVRLNGQVAEAEVTVTGESGSALRRLIYFRLTNGQWRLAPPVPDFFGPEQSTTTPHFRISYRERDQGLVTGLANLAEGAYVALCGELRCVDSSRPLELRLSYDASAQSPSATPGTLAVATPSLLGLRADGQPGADFERQVVSLIGAQLAGRKAPGASTALLEVVGDWAAAELAVAPTPMDDILLTALVDESLLPLDRAWNALVHGTSADPLARAELHSVLSFVQSAWGSDAVGRLLEHSSGALADMTQGAFQIDDQTFQARWLAWLIQQHMPVSGSSNS